MYAPTGPEILVSVSRRYIETQLRIVFPFACARQPRERKGICNGGGGGGVSMVKNGEILQWRNPFTIKIVHHFSPFFTIFHHFVFQFFKISIFCIGKLPLFFSLGVTALRHIIKDYNQCSYINLLLIIL